MSFDESPSYAIHYSANAELDIATAIIFTAAHANLRVAENWLDAFERSVATLSTLPDRYPIVPARLPFRKPAPRKFVFRRNPDAQGWIVIYRVHESTATESPFVEILSVRQGARKPMTRKEAREIDASG